MNYYVVFFIFLMYHITVLGLCKECGIFNNASRFQFLLCALIPFVILIPMFFLSLIDFWDWLKEDVK